MISTLRFAWICLLLCFASLWRAEAQAPPAMQGHTHLNVIPVSSMAPSLRVDGVLSEWNQDAFVTAYSDEDLKDVFSIRVALAYDASGLVIGARVTDTSPLVNLIDPRVQPFDGWRGDALQIRVLTDPAVASPIPATVINTPKIAHMTMWQYSRENLPALDVRFGMNYHGPVTLVGKDSGLVFQKQPGGYAMEGRVPWSTLQAKAPQPGQQWRMTLQALWGDNQGKMIHYFYDVMRGAGFHFQTPEGWGNAHFIKPESVAEVLATQKASEDKFAASRTKPPVYTVPVNYTNPRKGYVSLAIKNAKGQIVRTLLAHAMREAGLQREQWDGRDDDGNPVPAGEYFLSALTHPGITPRYVTSVMQSGEPAWDNDAWGADHGLPVAAASDPNGFTYLMWTFNEGGNYLIQVDRNGRKQWGSHISWGDFNGNATAVLHDGDYVYTAKDGVNSKGDMSEGGLFRYEAKTGRRVNFPDGGGKFLITQWPKKLLEIGNRRIDTNLVGLAASPTSIYYALHLENKIVELDKSTFRVRRSFDVPRPMNLVYDARRKRLIAISGNSIIAIDPAKCGTQSTLVGAGIEEPYGIALDKDGNMYVSVRGKQSQVLVFDARGKLKRRIGITGGRPFVGKYDPRGMLFPAGITVDNFNQLWVTETDSSPERISVWNAQSGRLAKEYFGTPSYAPMMAPDPDNPEHVYMHNVRFRVDYEKGTWYPEATVYRNGYSGSPMIPGSEQVYGWMGNTMQVRRYSGRTLAYQGHGGILAAEGDRWKPLLYMGKPFPGFPGLQPTDHPWQTAVMWRDANGDGIMQEAETSKQSGIYMRNNIEQFGGSFFPGAAFIQAKRVFQPKGFDSNGIPIYPQPTEAPPILRQQGEMEKYSNWLDVWPSFKNNWNEYYAIASEPHPIHKDWRGGGAGDGVFRFDRDGNIKWRYARAVVDFAIKSPPFKSPGLSQPGDMYGALRIAGLIEMPPANGGEIIGIGVYRGYFSFLTEDGLFIDQVGHEPGRAPKPNYDTFFIENFSGYVFKHPRTGKVYLFAGAVDGRILELQGFDKIQTFDAGKLTLTAEQANAVASGAPPVATNQRARSVSIYGDNSSRLGLLKIPISEGEDADAMIYYDQNSLSVDLRVSDLTPWKNGATDWRFLFKGGDALDIQLSRDTPLRVMMAPTADGKGVRAVGMWKQAPQGVAAQPMQFKSPVREENFAHVALLPAVRGGVMRRADGYDLGISIPWKALGLTPPALGTSTFGDVGVLFSDGSGARTILRRYAFNEDTSIVNDIPSEVQLSPEKWGEWQWR